LMIARTPFLNFSAFASDSFGPLLPILTPPHSDVNFLPRYRWQL
jgi:hypothetical protein